VSQLVFVAQEVIVDVSEATAQARLANLAGQEERADASAVAYQDGLTHLLRVGPLGSVPLLSRTVRASFLPPTWRGETMTIGLRWEAAGITARLFPVLDANLSVSPAGPGSATIALRGSYRPPLGRPGTILDRTLLSTWPTQPSGRCSRTPPGWSQAQPAAAARSPKLRSYHTSAPIIVVTRLLLGRSRNGQSGPDVT
jgi:hypothetical protein